VSRALSKDLDRRVQSAAALAAELRRVAPALDLRTDDRGGDYLLTVDDEADKVPLAVWLAVAGGVAVLGGAVWLGLMR
jgi:hypothetical protein